MHFTVFCGAYPALSVRGLKLIPQCSAGDRDGSTKGGTAALSRTGLSSSHGQEEGVSKKKELCDCLNRNELYEAAFYWKDI